MGDKSWDNLWSELLSVDLEIPGQQQPSSLESPDETGVSFNNVEGDIELWAAHSLQQSHDLSPHVHQPTPNGTSASDFESGDNEIICYGMVSTPYPLLLGSFFSVGSMDSHFMPLFRFTVQQSKSREICWRLILS